MFRTFAPALIGMALAIGGCGEKAGSPAGGSTGDTAGQSRLSKEEYVLRADAICAETVERKRRIDDRIAGIRLRNLRDQVAALLRAKAKEARAGHRRLKALRPPLDAQPQVDEYLEAVADALDAQDDYATAMRRNKRTAMLRAAREGSRFDGEQEILADLLGLVDCRRLV